ncbi:MAG: mechanosensitive ion channel family protein [Bacteroidales bacterium]|nr:mechanosensitive ion channel family protein [Bacteroidales bacterium]
MHIRRHLNIFAIAVTFMLAAPLSYAQEAGADSEATLSALLQELKESHAAVLQSDSLTSGSRQHREELAGMVKATDELTLKLYSQNPEFSFDMAFALEDISKLYESFREKASLSGNPMSTSKAGLRQYTLLGETLRGMILAQTADTLALDDSLVAVLPPPEPVIKIDSLQAALIDSCLFYTDALTGMYEESVAMALQDSLLYADTEKRLQQAYEYAQANYDDSQKSLFIVENANIAYIVKNWKPFIKNVKDEMRNRYASLSSRELKDGRVRLGARTWDGSYILAYSFVMLILLLLAFIAAILLNLVVFKFIKNQKIRAFRPILSVVLTIVLYVVLLLLMKPAVDNQYWKMSYDLLSQFSWLTLAIFISLLIRIDGSQAKASRNIYLPTLLLAFLSILMRSIYLPASVVPLLLPLALILFISWQSAVNLRYRKDVSVTDRRYTWASVGVMFATLICSLAGYAMVGVLLLTFWIFLLALLHTITTIYYLMKRYYDERVAQKKIAYHQENPMLPLSDKDAFIEVTWFYDIIRMVVVPLAIVWSVPASIHLTARVYKITSAGEALFSQPFFNNEVSRYLTLQNVILIIAIFFIFRYLIYLFKGLFRINKLRNIIEHDVRGVPLKENDVNLSLPNTIFSVIGWLLFFIVVFAILHVPTSALTLISTGLAAGLGFAMKDTINNLFYGIQLMAGRIRVGDKISCDGVRGVVQRVSYLSTQIEEEDGSLIAFTNTDLFTKNFKNLNSGKNYELLKIPVTVRYGTDLEKARQVILKALEPLMKKDKFGRDIIDPVSGVDIRLDHFGDSAINLFVVLYSTVETHYTFPARALEAIYKAFGENGIEIPFNQHDVYIKSK